jgi:hypothetical protein
MKPTNFKESNRTLTRPDALTDLECGDLHVWTDGKQCISCWKPTFRQKMSILFFGRIWLSIWSGKTQPPVWIDATKTVFKK